MKRSRAHSATMHDAPQRPTIAVSVTPEVQVTPTQCTDAESYALRVVGDGLAPQLPDGCIIIVDPGIAPCSGQYVIAETGDSVTLGILVEQSGNWLLHPRGIACAGITLQLGQVRGVVAQRAGRRRRDHLRFQ